MNRTTIRAVLIALAASALSACVTVTAAPTGAYKVGADYQVNLSHDWSDVSNIMVGRPKSVHLLSVDGPLLNRLYLSEGLIPGDFLVKPASKEQPTPTYRAGMTVREQVEFVADSVGALDYLRAETSNLRPAKFGDVDAVRFDITAKTKDGLDMAGAGEVAQTGGKLYVILYLAPAEHYYAAELSEVEAIFKSVRRAG